MGGRAPLNRLAPDEAGRQPTNRRQRRRPVLHLLDAHVDMPGQTGNPLVVQVAVNVHAARRDAPERHVRQQERRVAGHVQRAVDLIEAGTVDSPDRVDVMVPKTSSFRRPGAFRTRSSRSPHSGRRDTSPRQMMVSSGSTVRRQRPRSSSAISSVFRNGRRKMEMDKA